MRFFPEFYSFPSNAPHWPTARCLTVHCSALIWIGNWDDSIWRECPLLESGSETKWLQLNAHVWTQIQTQKGQFMMIGDASKHFKILLHFCCFLRRTEVLIFVQFIGFLCATLCSIIIFTAQYCILHNLLLPHLQLHHHWPMHKINLVYRQIAVQQSRES